MDGIKEVKNSPLLNALPIWYHSIYTDGIHPDARFPRDRYTKLVEKLSSNPERLNLLRTEILNTISLYFENNSLRQDYLLTKGIKK